MACFPGVWWGFGVWPADVSALHSAFCTLRVPGDGRVKSPAWLQLLQPPCSCRENREAHPCHGRSCTAPEEQRAMPAQTPRAPRDPSPVCRAELALVLNGEQTEFPHKCSHQKPWHLCWQMGEHRPGMNGKRCLHSAGNQSPSTREALRAFSAVS